MLFILFAIMNLIEYVVCLDRFGMGFKSQQYVPVGSKEWPRWPSLNKITSQKNCAFGSISVMILTGSIWFWVCTTIPCSHTLRFDWCSLGNLLVNSKKCPGISKHCIPEVVSRQNRYLPLAQRHVFCLRIWALKETPAAASIWPGWRPRPWSRPFRPSTPTTTASSPARNSSRRSGGASSRPIQDGLPCRVGPHRGLLLGSHVFLEKEIWDVYSSGRMNNVPPGCFIGWPFKKHFFFLAGTPMHQPGFTNPGLTLSLLSYSPWVCRMLPEE